MQGYKRALGIAIAGSISLYLGCSLKPGYAQEASSGDPNPSELSGENSVTPNSNEPVSTESKDLGSPVSSDDLGLTFSAESPESTFRSGDVGITSQTVAAPSLGLSTPDLFDGAIAAEGSAPASETTPSPATGNESAPPFVLPEQGPGFRPSQGLHCDVLEHLKTPRTYRRLDSYMRPTAFMPKGPENNILKRDFLTGDWGGLRTQLYEAGIEFYGCGGVDFARDIKSNLPEDPDVRAVVKNTPERDTQFNFTQVYGGEIYSRLFSKNWKGGQFHWSVTWPESKYPLYAYRNNLNPTGTGQIHGHFYTDQGVGAPTDLDQGVRVFELWFQQRYGPKQLSYVRVGNIFPMIQFNRSILADLFNFWTFTEPCMLGTTYFTGNAPCYPQAPLGIQVYHVLNDNIDLHVQVNQGYYASNGRNNRRGITWNLEGKNGVETIAEITYRGGTYSFNPKDNGKPWFFKIGGQYHSGLIYSNNLDINGDSAALTGLARKELYGNAQIYASMEAMLYREPGSYGQGLTMFGKTGGGFYNDRNVVKRWVTVGFGYEGLFPNRDRDVLYAGWGRVYTTDGFIAFQTANRPCRLVKSCNINGTQDVFEIGYSMELTPWLWITPMFQYLKNPNTRHDLGDIFVFGIATKFSF